MKLEDAVRKGLTIDGVECSSVREFISKLEKAKNLSMAVYVNTKLVCSGPALIRSDNNWIIASADCQISFKESVSVESIRAYIKQGSTELFESVTTNCNMIIPANDTLATFYVCLGNDAPYNELAKRVPESRFTPISVNRIPDTIFDDITSTLNDDADVTVDDGSGQEVDSPSTEETVYRDRLQYKAQTSVTAYSTPSSNNIYPIYMDAACTIQMPYDNTKKYKFWNKNWVSDTYYTLDEFLAGSEQSTTLIINNDGLAYAWQVTKSWAGGDVRFTYYDEQIKIADV